MPPQRCQCPAQSLLERLLGGRPAGLKLSQIAREEGAQVILADRSLMGKLVEPSQLPVHRGLDDGVAARLLVPGLPDDLNKAGRRLLALPLGERLIEPAEELPPSESDIPSSQVRTHPPSMTTAQRHPQPATPHGPPSRYLVLSRSAQAPSYRRRIPDGRYYAALRSTRNHPRTAVHPTAGAVAVQRRC
jgi:hypothetical protein